MKAIGIQIILHLITVAYHSIIFSIRQLAQRRSKILNDNRLGTSFCQRIKDGTGFHERNRHAFYITKTVMSLISLAIDNLIIQAKDGTGIIGNILAISGIHHHAKIDFTMQYIASNILPRVRRIGKRNIKTLHQQLGEVDIGTMGKSFLVDKLQRRVVDINAEKQRIVFRIAKSVRTCCQSKCKK